MVRELGQSKMFPGAQAYEIGADEMAQVIIAYLVSQRISVPDGNFTVIIQRKVGDFIIHLVPKES